MTKAAGLDYIHNTFQGVFVDMNNDSWLDLVVAYDTGEARTYKNNGEWDLFRSAESINRENMLTQWGLPWVIIIMMDW